MKRLPLKAKKIIRKKKFSLNTITENDKNWSRGLDIKCRITNIVTEHERWYEEQSPYNPKGNKIFVNLKVSGKVTTSTNWDGPRYMKDVAEVANYKRQGGSYGTGWGCFYNSSYDRIWGYDAHKKIRNEIRNKLTDQLKNYLKLLGICMERHWQNIEIKKISWEK